jgi:hypothetical protein
MINETNHCAAGGRGGDYVENDGNYGYAYEGVEDEIMKIILNQWFEMRTIMMGMVTTTSRMRIKVQRATKKPLLVTVTVDGDARPQISNGIRRQGCVSITTHHTMCSRKKFSENSMVMKTMVVHFNHEDE